MSGIKDEKHSGHYVICQRVTLQSATHGILLWPYFELKKGTHTDTHTHKSFDVIHRTHLHWNKQHRKKSVKSQTSVMQITDSYKALGLTMMVMIDFRFSRLFRATPTCVSAVIIVSNRVRIPRHKNLEQQWQTESAAARHHWPASHLLPALNKLALLYDTHRRGRRRASIWHVKLIFEYSTSTAESPWRTRQPAE